MLWDIEIMVIIIIKLSQICQICALNNPKVVYMPLEILFPKLQIHVKINL